VKLLKASAIKGDEELEIEYSYGVFSSPFQTDSVFLSMQAPIAVDTLSQKLVEKAVQKVEDSAQDFFSEIKDKKQEKVKPEVEPASINEPIEQEIAPEVEPAQEETKQNEQVVEEEEIIEEIPAPQQEPNPELPESAVEPEVTQEVNTPPEEQLPPPPISKTNSLKSAITNVFETITKRISFIESARAQTTTVEAFQIKLKAATSKGEQTFQILPDGTVYLYHGSSIEAISKPKFQFLQNE
jgi:hypothetical protein